MLLIDQQFPFEAHFRRTLDMNAPVRVEAYLKDPTAHLHLDLIGDGSARMQRCNRRRGSGATPGRGVP